MRSRRPTTIASWSRRWPALVVDKRGWMAVLVAAIVVAAGLVYVAKRGETWQSTASVVVSPRDHPSSDRSSALATWGNSESNGTYEELLGSSDVLNQAQVADSVDVRPVPDSRVIEVTASGARETVQGDLRAILVAAKSRGHGLNDLWTLQTLDAPSAPTTAGPSTLALLLAALALATVAGVAAFVLLGALGTTMWQRTPQARDLNGKPEHEIDRVPAAAGVAGAAVPPPGDAES